MGRRPDRPGRTEVIRAARGALVAAASALVAAWSFASELFWPATTAISTPRSQQAQEVHAELAILATADLHARVLSFDYDRLRPEPSYGFARTASLIRAARREFANSLLFDVGDTIEGSALGDFEARVRPIGCQETLTIYRAMKALGYDAGTLGNHEFNYGLAFLARATGQMFDVTLRPGDGPLPETRCRGPGFPLVLANVVSAKTGQPLFPPYVILERELEAKTPAGQSLKRPLRIGVIGFAPPRILEWDKRWLDGVVQTTDALEAFRRYEREMRARGAELIIALVHSGLDARPYSATMENFAWHLAQQGGMDVLLLGHAHRRFPDPEGPIARSQLPGVDAARGFVHGVPAVMPGFWGQALGVVRLQLRWRGHAQAPAEIVREATRVELRLTVAADGQPVAADPEVEHLAAAAHERVVAHLSQPLTQSDYTISTYFADVGELSALELINRAQAAYVARELPRVRPDLAQLPVLSAAAPFKTGFSGPQDYTFVPPGAVRLHHVSDLYIYPNTLEAVRVSGAELKAWLEASARRFNRIDPSKTEPQMLIAAVPGFNFDVFTDPELRYEIDVTRPLGERITRLEYRGRPVAPEDSFIVATNNYRASGGGGFPGLDGSKTVFAPGVTSREVVSSYLRGEPRLTRATHASARSWRFAPVVTNGPVLFRSSADAQRLLPEAGLEGVSLWSASEGVERGYALYRIDLSAAR
ncbi:MAG: 5'-nucleotidase C-terminal domain-containing protein [Burkholderiales bacterium]|nr:5'-nucleotidase C-terminal domain-containing protein [Burkholderiales bacterium]